MNEYNFSDLIIGHTEHFGVIVTKEMEDSFRNITGDINPLHQGDVFACRSGKGKFKGHVCFGMLTASFYSTLAGVYLPGKHSLIHSLDIKFQKPVYIGDQLTVSGKITDKQNELQLFVSKGEFGTQRAQGVAKASLKGFGLG